MKKNVLLVGDVHLHITMGYFKLLSDQYKVDIYWSKKYKKNVNSFLKKKTNFFNHPSGLIYFFLFFKSFKYDFVFIATGPEFYNGIKGLVGILGYLIFVFFHGKKTIMGIRDNKKYFRNNNRDFIERIINFVMSCRALSRGIEEKFIDFIFNNFTDISHLEFKESPRNAPAKSFILGLKNILKIDIKQ